MKNPVDIVKTCATGVSTCKLRLIMLLFIAIPFFSKPAIGQHVQVNISLQPLWGPVGYDYVEYYYLPEADVYYYVPTHQFIYWRGGRWVYVNYLPWYYNVNLYTTYKVVINQPRAYMYHSRHRKAYWGHRHSHNRQTIIRDSRDTKYHVVKGHPRYKAKKNVGPDGTQRVKRNNNATHSRGVKPSGKKPDFNTRGTRSPAPKQKVAPGATRNNAPKQNTEPRSVQPKNQPRNIQGGNRAPGNVKPQGGKSPIGGPAPRGGGHNGGGGGNKGGGKHR